MNMNMNKAEMNDNMMVQVNGGYLGQSYGWTEGNPEKHLKYKDYGVEVEINLFSSNVYKINGTEVSEKNAFEYARAMYHEELDYLDSLGRL